MHLKHWKATHWWWRVPKCSDFSEPLPVLRHRLAAQQSEQRRPFVSDIGEVSAAKSNGLVRLSHCSESHSERDVEVLSRQYKNPPACANLRAQKEPGSSLYGQFQSDQPAQLDWIFDKFQCLACHAWPSPSRWSTRACNPDRILEAIQGSQPTAHAVAGCRREFGGPQQMPSDSLSWRWRAWQEEVALFNNCLSQLPGLWNRLSQQHTCPSSIPFPPPQLLWQHPHTSDADRVPSQDGQGRTSLQRLVFVYGCRLCLNDWAGRGKQARGPCLGGLLEHRGRLDVAGQGGQLGTQLFHGTEKTLDRCLGPKRDLSLVSRRKARLWLWGHVHECSAQGNYVSAGWSAMEHSTSVLGYPTWSFKTCCVLLFWFVALLPFGNGEELRCQCFCIDQRPASWWCSGCAVRSLDGLVPSVLWRGTDRSIHHCHYHRAGGMAWPEDISKRPMAQRPHNHCLLPFLGAMVCCE